MPQTAAAPARAGVAAPSARTAASALSSLHVGTVGLPKDTLNSPAVTPPAGNVTVDIDLGTAYSQTYMKSWISQVESENPHISDTIERFLQDRPVNYPGGVTVPAVPQFDGTLSLDSDGTGLSLTLPASEADVQTSATWWQNFLIGVAGFLVASLVAVCLIAVVRTESVSGFTSSGVCANRSAGTSPSSLQTFGPGIVDTFARYSCRPILESARRVRSRADLPG